MRGRTDNRERGFSEREGRRRPLLGEVPQPAGRVGVARLGRAGVRAGGAAQALAGGGARLLPLPTPMALYFTCLSLVPLLGSLITEPAAMTLAALMLRDRYYRHPLSTRLQYGTLGVLFVNISIGGALTPFAAPPVRPGCSAANCRGWRSRPSAARARRPAWCCCISPCSPASSCSPTIHRYSWG